MRIVERGTTLECRVECRGDVALRSRSGERSAQHRERLCLWLRAHIRFPEDALPVLALQEFRLQFDAHQRSRRDSRTRRRSSHAIGLVLLPSCLYERVGAERRRVPLEEGDKEELAPVIALIERVRQPGPAGSQPIDPSAELSMLAGEMAELMRDYGSEFLDTEGLHERQPEHQVIARPAEYAEARMLHDGGIEVVCDEHRPRSRRAPLVAHTLTAMR